LPDIKFDVTTIPDNEERTPSMIKATYLILLTGTPDNRAIRSLLPIEWTYKPFAVRDRKNQTATASIARMTVISGIVPKNENEPSKAKLSPKPEIVRDFVKTRATPRQIMKNAREDIKLGIRNRFRRNAIVVPPTIPVSRLGINANQ
jgi:hypothetical protein